MKPFEYLKTEVRTSIAKAIAARKEAYPARQDNHLASAPEVSLLTGDSEVKLGVLRNSDKWHEYPPALKSCFQCALDDPSDLIRGMCWCVIGVAHDKRVAPELLRELVQDMLQHKFQLPENVAISPLIDAWLDGVAFCMRTEEWNAKHGREAGRVTTRSESATRSAQLPTNVSDSKLFADEDAKVRAAAIRGLDHSSKDTDILLIVIRMLAEDTSEEVKICAVNYLIGSNRNSRNGTVLRALAAAVLNERQPYYVREYAYRGLFEIDGPEIQRWPGPQLLAFPGDVDWPYVRSFLGSSET